MSKLIICCAGLKGAQFCAGILAEGMRPERIVSYDQPSDGSNSFDALKELARANGIDVEVNRRPEFEVASLVFVVGWQYLLAPSGGMIVVFHDSLLPRYRGFAPTVAALISGDHEIGVSALIPDAGIDTGPLLGQVRIPIRYPIKIWDALHLQANAMVELGRRVYEEWCGGALRPVPQDERFATHSIWRDENDYQLDWTRPAAEICRTIDALGPPYASARTQLAGETILLHEAELVDDIRFAERHPGKIWRIADGKPVIVCGSGMVRVVRATSLDGSNYRFQSVRRRLGPAA